MNYIPILRLGPIETRLMTNELSGKDILPLLEITDASNFAKGLKTANEKFGSNFMVELPLYLSEAENKHLDRVSQLIVNAQRNSGKLSAQSNFYMKNREVIPIPVISAEERNPLSIYNQIISRFQDLKDHFESVAIRIFVSHLRLTEGARNEIKTIFDIMRPKDMLLLGVVNFEGVELGVHKNLSEIMKTKSEENNKNKVYILNAFDIRDIRSETHNYNPLLCKTFEMDGMGDFATISRLEPSGGGGSPTRIIRFYYYWDHKLVPFVSPAGGYLDALRRLKNSPIWKKALDDKHVENCEACQEAENTSNEGHSFWKKFRILHHINSMLTGTVPMMEKYANPEDFDIDGYDNIFKKSGD